MSGRVPRCGRLPFDEILASILATAEPVELAVLAGPADVMSRMAHEIVSYTPDSVFLSTNPNYELLAELMAEAGTHPDSVAVAQAQTTAQFKGLMPQTAALLFDKDCIRTCAVFNQCVQLEDIPLVVRLARNTPVIVTVCEEDMNFWPSQKCIHVKYASAEGERNRDSIVFHVDEMGKQCRWKAISSTSVKLEQSKEREQGLHSDSPEPDEGKKSLESTRSLQAKTTENVLVSLLSTMQVDRIVLPEFFGQVSSYLPFRRVLFQIMDYEKNAAVLFSKLKDACKGSALKTIEGCSLLPPEQGLQQAITLLDSRYGDPDVMVDEVCGSLVKGPAYEIGIDNGPLVDYTCSIRASLAILQELTTSQGVDYIRIAESPRVIGSIIARLPESWRNGFLGKVRGRPTFEALSDFVTTRASVLNSVVYRYVAQRTRAQKMKRERAREAFSASKFTGEPPVPTGNVFSTTGTGVSDHSGGSPNVNMCPLCGQAHSLDLCGQFKEKTPRQRARVLKRLRACFACLKVGHTNAECKAPSTKCSVQVCAWTGAHHPMLCRVKDGGVFNVTEADLSSESEDSEAEPCAGNSDHGVKHAYNSIDGAQKDIFMNILAVILTNVETGRSVSTYALLDPCANVDIISDAMASKLNLPVKQMHRGVSKIGTVSGYVNMSERRTTVSVAGVPEWSVSRVLDNVAVLPCEHFSGIKCPVKLEGEYPGVGEVPPVGPVDHPVVSVLISMRHWDLHVPQAVHSKKQGGPKLIRTPLGFVVMGPCYGQSVVTEGRTVANFAVQCNSSVTYDKPAELVAEMCRIPDYKDLYSPEKAPSRVERDAWARMEDSVTLEDGHYVVRQPWKADNPHFPDNLHQALGHLESTRKSFRKNHERFAKYASVVSKHIALGHAEKVPSSEIQTPPGKRFYLLHHAVQHPRKDEPRVVFNASKSCRGQSMNSSILKSPDLLNNLIGVVIRFRERTVAISADIKGFYLAVRVPRQDRNLARFLWFARNDLDGEPEHYRLKVHLFGGIASQAAAIIALKRTLVEAEVNGFITKEQAMAYTRSFYSDDFLASYDDPASALISSQTLVNVLDHRKFQLAKWRSSHQEVNVGLGATFRRRGKGPDRKGGGIGSRHQVEFNRGLLRLSVRNTRSPAIAQGCPLSTNEGI